MVLEIAAILSLVGLFILIGYISEYIFRRFGIPDIIILIAVGIIIGPASGLLGRSDAMQIMPVLMALAITIILFNGGSNVNYDKLKGLGKKAIIFASIVFLLSVLITLAIVPSMLGFDLLTAALVGTAIGGISASMILPLANKIRPKQKLTTLLMLESSYTDVMVIIATLAILYAISSGTGIQVTAIASTMTPLGILIGIALGVGVALAWTRIMLSMMAAYEDILTLAIAFALYGISEYIMANGAISVLAFAILFGNASRIFKSVPYELPHVRDTVLELSAKRFQSQIAFMVRAILFILLGSMLTINGGGIVIAGIVIALALLFPRIAASWISIRNDPELKKDVWLLNFMLSRGFAAGAAAILPMLYNIQNSAPFMNIVSVVIITTIVITAIILRSRARVSVESDSKLSKPVIASVGFAIIIGVSLAYNISVNGQLFSTYTILERTESEGFAEAMSLERTYFFDSSSVIKNASKIYGESNVISYRWEFGDGSISAEPEVVHQYAEKGQYTVRLIIIRQDGITYAEKMHLNVE